MNRFTAIFILSIVLQSYAFGQSSDERLALNPLKAQELKSAEFINSNESCEEVLNHHVAVVEDSEAFILSLAHKKSINISPFEITMLQKILTNRYLHLTKAVNMYRDSSEGDAACSPRLMGNVIAVYDFSKLGKEALSDSRLRRIILNFTNFPKYKLTKLKELYDHYTSKAVIQNLLEQINEEKISMPNNLIINEDQNGASFYALSDAAVDGTSSVVSGSAKLWGFISDQLKWRNGRLNQNTEAYELLRSNLKPLDLIYEKRNFTLSNYTIPGHWGHVAVWLGSKEELQDLGIWDKEYFAPFRSFVEAGKNIIEIRKKGMNAVALADFMNLDEIAITRISSAISDAEDIFEELSEQIDKKYDFTFNAQSTDKLTCSEFIAFSYGDIHWPETETLFQVSIKPDDLAILTLYKNSPAEFVLYLKGNKDKSFEQKDFNEWKKLFGSRAEKELNYE